MKKFFYKTSLLSGLNFSIINGINIEFKSKDEYFNLFYNGQQNLEDTSENFNLLNNSQQNLEDISSYSDSKDDIYSDYKNILEKIIRIYKKKKRDQ